MIGIAKTSTTNKAPKDAYKFIKVHNLWELGPWPMTEQMFVRQRHLVECRRAPFDECGKELEAAGFPRQKF